MDGTNWNILAMMDVSNHLTTTLVGYSLNFDNGSWVSTGRFAFLRVVAVNSAPGGTYTLAVRVGVVKHVGLANTDTAAVTRTGATVTTAGFIRRGGVRQSNVQVVFSAVTCDGGSYDINVEGSADGVRWAPISATINTAVNGAQSHWLRGPNGEDTIDFGGFLQIRAKIVSVGVGAGAAFTGIVYVGTDTGDWLAYESPLPSGGGGLPDGAAVKVNISTTGSVIAPADSPVTIQVTDMNDVPVVGVRNLYLILSDTQFAGDVALSAGGIFNGLFGVGTLVAGDLSNRVAVRTNAAGLLQINVNKAAPGPGTYYISAQSSLPTSEIVIAQCDQTSVIFT
jgi:hypothetical protein